MGVEAVGVVKVERTIRASRQAVWDALTQPEQMKVWSCPAPGGVEEVTSDLRVGGSYSIRMVVDGEEHTAYGIYREIDEPRRLVYTWAWTWDGPETPDAIGETVVTVELEEVDDGTEVVLVHEGFPTEESRKGHDVGWNACLDHLEGMFD